MRCDCVQKSFETSETSRSFENNILSRAIQSAFEINIAQLQSRARPQKTFTRVMFHQGRNKRDFIREIISRPQTLKNTLNFLVELKPLFHESLQGSRKQFQSKRLVMLRTDVYVTADLYQAEQQDKPRIDGRYKKNILLLVPAGGGGGGENSHMKGAGILVVSLRGVNLT